MAEQTIFDGTIVVPATTDLFIIAGGKQSYSSTSGSLPWQMTLYFNGTQINYAGGASAYTDSVSLFGMAQDVAPGSYNVKLTWQGDTHITLNAGVNMLVMSTYK